MAITMAGLNVAYALLLAGFTAIAIYVQVTSSTLSFPLSTGTTVLTIILPLLAAVNFFGTDLLKRTLPRRASASLTLQLYLPVVLQLIQGVLTVVLATLTAEGLEPVDCILEGNWSRLYRAKDDRALERIQDTFNCCGLRSIVDRTAPRGECKNIYKDRHDSCLSPWHASMQRSAGLDFAVALAVGIFQLVQLALFTVRSSKGGWASKRYGRTIQSIGSGPSDRLLGDGTANDDDDDDEDTSPEGNNGTSGTHHDYGTTEGGPRVQPSNLGDSSEENTWRS
ncbi:hypothetical protein F4821DRAFT_238151 [Hypoxylon rubiginosum]|uniref:Uncharacterized protein n=1 Tax=Hypoxylon rubiginosum TaxID=110542 RepID=A0ACC0D1L1_9PEZI|nr:hypothetical protein F4821DRAFT_238151 [Hypoxylon rubiginosum]